MSRLVDSDAVLLDLRARLGERPSWGTGQVRALIDELELAHRIVESTDREVLRRFGDHVLDTVLGELPAPATPDPLTAADRETAPVMDGGADLPSQHQEKAHARSTPADHSRRRRDPLAGPAARA